MRAYVVATGLLFGAITVAHALRMMQEKALATQPWYILITAASAALCVWAWSLFRGRRPT